MDVTNQQTVTRKGSDGMLRLLDFTLGIESYHITRGTKKLNEKLYFLRLYPITGVSKTMKPVKGCNHDDCVDVKYYLFSSSFRFGFQTAELVSEKKNTTQKQVKRGMFPKQFTATQR